MSEVLDVLAGPTVAAGVVQAVLLTVAPCLFLRAGVRIVREAFGL